MDFNAFIQKLGITRLVVGAGVLVLSGWLFFVLSDQLTKPDMALLYGDLDVGDAGRIVAKLEDRNIATDVRGGGTQVYVPVDQVARLRMDMAEAGLPSGGTVGYEIFDQTDVFGTSFFVQNVNHVRALEGELARTIRTINQIASARVHLVLPRRELFNNDKQEPTASIVIRMHSPGRLDDARVQSIQYLVASAVPNLTPERVSVVDDRGNLLSSGSIGNTEHAMMQKSEEARASYEARLETAIRSLLERTLGVGMVRAEVAAEMDFDRIVENSETFDPEGSVPRSSLTVEEQGNSTESSGASGSSVANEIPGGSGSTSGENKNTSKRTEETINYEVSKTIRSLTKESGSVKKLSIAVLVDGTRKKAEDGKESYEPRTKEELQQIEKLVKSAVGFDEKRGDTLEVVNMPFKNDPLDAGAEIDASMFNFQPHDIVRMIEILVLGVIGLLMLLLVIKPFITRLMEALNEASTSSSNPEASVPQQPVSHAAPEQNIPTPSNDESMVSLEQVDGEVKKSSINRVSDIIEKHPEETVSLVRNWMNQ